MARVLSGIQPTGDLHLGNLLGAVSNWVADQHTDDSFYCVVDLHAMTNATEPGALGRASLELAQCLIAAGLDPTICTLFVQSHVPAHAELGWIMQCICGFGQLERMTQFKDKSDRRSFVSAGLFTYPALQAADILLYDTARVPVGEDQRQHIELTRDLADRFNHRFGDTFRLPEAAIPRAGARVMDLQHPTDKMSKSADSTAGTILLTDAPDVVVKKFKRAVTDSDGVVAYDVANKPGVSNLLSILAATTGGNPDELADQYSQYGPLKSDTGEAVVAMLEPIQMRLAELRRDPEETTRLLRIGAEKASAVAESTMQRVRSAVGFLPR
ncbi:MAG: tryptophan--tRNA ligase [Actinomycetes bacterium]